MASYFNYTILGGHFDPEYVLGHLLKRHVLSITMTGKHASINSLVLTKYYMETSAPNSILEEKDPDFVQDLEERYFSDPDLWDLVLICLKEGIDKKYIQPLVETLSKMRSESVDAKTYALYTLLEIGDPQYLQSISQQKLIQLFSLKKVGYGPRAAVIFER